MTYCNLFNILLTNSTLLLSVKRYMYIFQKRSPPPLSFLSNYSFSLKYYTNFSVPILSPFSQILFSFRQSYFYPNIFCPYPRGLEGEYTSLNFCYFGKMYSCDFWLSVYNKIIKLVLSHPICSVLVMISRTWELFLKHMQFLLQITKNGIV